MAFTSIQALSVAMLVAMTFLASTTRSADPDPLQDICVADLSRNITLNGYPCKHPSAATAEDFVFHALANRANTSNAYRANSVAGFDQSFPGLNTLGLAIARLDFDVGGLIPPHTHPTASELVYVEEGSVYAGFVTQDNRLFAQIMNRGDVMIVPRALVHWQMNVGNSTAKIIAVVNSQGFGTQLVASSLFGSGIRDDVLAKTFFMDPAIVRQLQTTFGG